MSITLKKKKKKKKKRALRNFGPMRESTPIACATCKGVRAEPLFITPVNKRLRWLCSGEYTASMSITTTTTKEGPLACAT